jgi:nucleoid-associated protein EbfC
MRTTHDARRTTRDLGEIRMTEDARRKTHDGRQELIVIPGGGQPNMQQLLQQAQKMQQDLARAQEELANTEVEGRSGGGLVKATVTGAGELRALVSDPKAVDPEDTETLADLVVAAVQAANQNAQALQQQKLGPLAQGLGGGGIPGLPF